MSLMLAAAEQSHHLVNVHHWLQSGGYVALFGLLFACGLGLPLPEDVPLITAGVFIAHGHMHLALAAPLAWCGIIGGDCVLYYLGYKLGWKITHLPVIGAHVSEVKLKRVERWFDAYGIWAVGIGRMFAGVCGAMVIVAGTMRFNFGKFLLADGLAAVVSGGIFFMSLGYWGGKHSGKMKETVEKFREYFIAAAAVAAVGLIVFFWLKSRKKTPGQLAVEAVLRPMRRAGGDGPRGKQ